MKRNRESNIVSAPIAARFIGENSRLRPGLPDGLFSNQKFQFWVNFVGPKMGKMLI
jgi:hypothetical protein